MNCSGANVVLPATHPSRLLGLLKKLTAKGKERASPDEDLQLCPALAWGVCQGQGLCWGLFPVAMQMQAGQEDGQALPTSQQSGDPQRWL